MATPKTLRGAGADAGAGALALTVPRRARGPMLAAFGPLLLNGLTLYCVDGGNTFDCTALIDWLRSRRADVRGVLSERIFLSRAFTCHQLAAAVDELLGPLADAGTGGPRAALILGVETMFLDEDIRLAERRYLFGRILTRSGELTRRGLPILITCGQAAPDPWARRLAAGARLLPDLRPALPVLGSVSDGTHLEDV